MHDAASIPFHLLRPLWLLALIPVAAIFAMLLWRQNPRAQWGGVIAPHLLQHLIVQPGQGRGVSPLYLVTGRPGAGHCRAVGTDLAARAAALRRGQGAADDRARLEHVDESGRCRADAA